MGIDPKNKTTVSESKPAAEPFQDLQETETKKWREEAAMKRFLLISRLLDPELDRDKRIMLRKKIADENDVTVRSLYRYEAAFRKDGFTGLYPKAPERDQSDRLPENFQELLQEAIQLKREVPTRSVAQIILILEMEERVPTGILKRSTLEKHLLKNGFGKKQMKAYQAASTSSGKRYGKPHRMMLAQADIKFIMKLPIGPKGGMIQCYICSIIDDHSKMILGTGVYDTQETTIVEDVYRRAILSFGAFDKTYVDNGKQFVSKELIDALARLGITHLRTPPYSGKSKGKIEVYNRLINSYIAECKAQKVRTMEEARHYWELFVEDYYHTKPHEGIREYYESHGVEVPAEGITPLQEFNRDSRPLKFLDASVVGKAFLHHETRTISSGATFSFDGRKYTVPGGLIGAKGVDIYFDPMDTDTITVKYKGKEYESHPLVISEYCERDAKVPEHMLPVEPETSRFFKGLEKKHAERADKYADAISFAEYQKEVKSGV